jgi:LPXTG-motif cell wall-anchored protein
MTGSSTLVLALLGFALVGAGVAVMAVRRRRLSTGVMAIGLLVVAATLSHAPRAEAEVAAEPCAAPHPAMAPLPPGAPHGSGEPALPPSTTVPPHGGPSTTFPLGIPTTTTTLPIGIPTTTTTLPIGAP